MVKQLTAEERASLHRFSQAHFNLDELKDLAFELGVEYESLPHNTTGELSRELISYFERKDNLSCLLQHIVSLRESDELVGLLARLPPCAPRSKVQIITRGTHKELPEDLLARLAEWAGTSGEEVELINGVPGSTHLLFSLPDETLFSLTSQPSDLWKSIVSFDALDELSQVAWRTVCVYLPLSTDELLDSEIRWDEIIGLIEIAKRSLQEARTNPPGRAAYHYYAGLLLLRMERWVDAIRSFSETAALAPTFSLAYLNRGFAHEALARLR
jgi:tetratricopeptide (TPR) repeat protein